MVETPDGETVTGATVVTGMDSATLTVLGETVQFGADTVVTFNRDRDILRISVQPTAGRLLQVAVFRVGELDMRLGEDIWLGARIHVDTMSVSIPGDLVDAGGWSDGGNVFRAGRDYIMTASVTDVNYYDFNRSHSNKSASASSLALTVTGEFDDEREGSYWLRGILQGIAVDAILTVYTVRSADDTEASALLTGDWLKLGTVGEGELVWVPAHAERLLFEGKLEGNHFGLVALQPGAMGVNQITMNGDRKPVASFVLSLADSMRARTDHPGNVSVTQRQ